MKLAKRHLKSDEENPFIFLKDLVFFLESLKNR